MKNQYLPRKNPPGNLLRINLIAFETRSNVIVSAQHLFLLERQCSFSTQIIKDGRNKWNDIPLIF